MTKFVAGQNLHRYCKARVDSLIKTGIDTIVYYQPYDGPTHQETNECCMIHEHRYLLWKTNQTLFVLNHYDYLNIKNNSEGKKSEVSTLNDSSCIFDFLYKNFETIVSDKLIPAKLKYTIDGKEVIDDYSKIHVSDDNSTQVMIFTNGKVFENGYASQDLADGTMLNADGTFREKRESINYQANINKTIYKFITKIEGQVNQLK